MSQTSDNLRRAADAMRRHGFKKGGPYPDMFEGVCIMGAVALVTLGDPMKWPDVITVEEKNERGLMVSVTELPENAAIREVIEEQFPEFAREYEERWSKAAACVSQDVIETFKKRQRASITYNWNDAEGTLEAVLTVLEKAAVNSE